MKRAVVHGLGMFALGSSLLLVTGWATEWRARHAVLGDGRAVERNGTDNLPAVPAAFSSLAVRLQMAAEALQNRQQAAPVLDGALRAVRVFDYAGVSPITHRLEQEIAAARTALQNGRRELAAQAARRAASLIAAADVRPPVARAPALGWYADATVIDSTGRTVGHTAGFADDQLLIDRSSLSDVLGLVSVSDRPGAAVPLERLVFGRPQLVGPTLVLVLGAVPGA